MLSIIKKTRISLAVKAFFILSFLLVNESQASSIDIHHKDATVWHPKQTISGKVEDGSLKEVMVFHNDKSFAVKVKGDQTFAIDLLLNEGENKIWIMAKGQKGNVVSDTLDYTLGYNPGPVVKPYATVHKNEVTLHASTIENPYNSNFQYLWIEDPRNPVATNISDEDDSVATVNIPEKQGKYYYNLLIIEGQDTSRFQTYVTQTGKNIKAYDLEKDAPSWMQEAVIYQVTPYNFVDGGKFKDITAKLPELKELGINTLWLQPVFKSSYKGQGYDVVDYLGVNPDLGTDEELRTLIATAKDLGIKVLFDVVLNHTSIQHPFAQDKIQNGKESHYDNFYQQEDDGKPYASLYQNVDNGFITYFWKDLVNLNYDNEEVQRWILEVVKYWVKEYDIDGYRYDAIWGVNSRMPSFAKRMRTELNSIKPDLLLLAEAKGCDPKVFEQGFDAAYDWTADTTWVSQWAWEYDYVEGESHTIFNHPDVEQRGKLLKDALNNNGKNLHKQLRWLENNDLPRFIAHHQVETTKLAAALLFSLPGIPMLYNGQEIGFKDHPFATQAVFDADENIKDQDGNGLYAYYQKLIQIRKDHPALRSAHLETVKVSPKESLVGLVRKSGEETIFILLNMSDEATEAEISLDKLMAKNAKPVMHDILNGDSFKMKKKGKALKVPMQGNSVRYIKVN